MDWNLEFIIEFGLLEFATKFFLDFFRNESSFVGKNESVLWVEDHVWVTVLPHSEVAIVLVVDGFDVDVLVIFEGVHKGELAVVFVYGGSVKETVWD